MESYFKKYSLGTVNNNEIVVIPNEKNTIFRKYNFFMLQDGTWKEEKKKITVLIKKLVEKYKVKDWKSKWLINNKEKTINFYDSFRERIVSKIKELGEDTKSSGKQCSLGQNKKVITQKMKELEKVLQSKLKTDNKLLNVKSTRDMCSIIMLLSYHLTYKYNEKYNYNLLEGFLYDVNILPKMNKEKVDKDGNTLFLV